MSEKRLNPLEINCTACGQTALARAEARYEGFRKVGELFICTACGHRYANRKALPLASDGTPRARVFTAADRPETVKVFAENERRHSCGWCSHFVVNPFGQRCGISNRETEATDLCEHFEARPEAPQGEQAKKPDDPLASIFGD